MSLKNSYRIAVALVVGAVGVAYIVHLARMMPQYGTDFDPVRFAAKLVLRGEDPYPLIGPRLRYFWNYRLRYPATAVVLGLPFTAIPIVAARAVFVALTSGSLAFLVTRQTWWPLLVFFSASWWAAVGIAQWSPIMLAATMAPALGFVVAAKPNLGLAALAAMKSRRSVALACAGAALVTAISFALVPHWLSEWRAIARDTPDVRPLASTLFGAPLLIAALKWRRPEARLLLAFAVVPMNPGLYEGVMLFMVPSSAIQAAILALGSWAVEPLAARWTPSGATYDVGTRATGQAMLICMFLPALLMVVQRPNSRPDILKHG